MNATFFCRYCLRHRSLDLKSKAACRLPRCIECSEKAMAAAQARRAALSPAKTTTTTSSTS